MQFLLCQKEPELSTGNEEYCFGHKIDKIRRYASLYIVTVIDAEESELALFDLIHVKFGFLMGKINQPQCR